MSAGSRSEAAFPVYLGLGPDRSLSLAHAALVRDPSIAGFRRAPSLRTLETWSATGDWPGRVRELERQALDAEVQEHIQRVRDYRARLRKEALLLQQKGIAWLSAKESGDVRAHEALRAISDGFRLEALSLGEATDRLAIEQPHDDRLEALSDDELDRLINSIRATPGGSPEPQGQSSS